MAVYYVEVNLICIVVLCLIRLQLHSKDRQFSTEDRYFVCLTWSTVILCLSDLVAGLCRGKLFTGARAVIEISNLLYYVSMTLASYLWLMYVMLKLGDRSYNKAKTALWSLPLLIFTVMAAINPFTEFLFRINENNLYVRGSGIYYHWLLTYFYLFAATVKIIIALVRAKSPHARRRILPLIYFIIPPLIASVIQMFFYGVTASQVGITVSVLLTSLSDAGKQIVTDPLTGLNNRNGFNKYLEKHLLRFADKPLSFLMIDINNFKQINDGFGHIVGDRALIEAAAVIYAACEKMPIRLFICRYGGDEFLISGIDCTEEDIKALKNNIDEMLKESESQPYRLSFSIGAASGVCADWRACEELIRKADAAMYQEKRRFKESLNKSFNKSLININK